MLEFNPDILFQIKSVNRCLYFVTEEEDRFLQSLHLITSKSKTENIVKIYNQAFGLRLLSDHLLDWSNKKHTVDKDTLAPQQGLEAIYKDTVKANSATRLFYVITDPERLFAEGNFQRRLLNIIHQIKNDTSPAVKILLFVGTKVAIPNKLARYIDVIQDNGLSQQEITHISKSYQDEIKIPSPDISQLQGFTAWELHNLFYSFYQKQKSTPDWSWSDHIMSFKIRQLAKTKLLSVESTDVTSDQVGGLSRFKKWVSLVKACWTPEGRKFGLKNPKAVLLLGMWGCGKSMSVRFMAHEWGVNLLRVNTGVLRGATQGESENNIHKILTIADQMAPCILWVDEAGRALSGSQSSNATDSGTTDRMLGILDTWIEEHKSQVCLVLTTNDLSTLPTEIVDRTATKFFFDLPGSDARGEIINIHLKKRNQTIDVSSSLVSSSDGLGGRNIEAAIDYAMMRSFNEGLESLSPDILEECLNSTPRLSEIMTQEFTALRSWVGYDDRTGEGVKALLAEEPETTQLSLE